MFLLYRDNLKRTYVGYSEFDKSRRILLWQQRPLTDEKLTPATPHGLKELKREATEMAHLKGMNFAASGRGRIISELSGRA